MKEVQITGKHNVDLMTGRKKTAKRVAAKGVVEPEHAGQIRAVNMLFMGKIPPNGAFLSTEIDKKRQGYKAQDTNKIQLPN